MGSNKQTTNNRHNCCNWNTGLTAGACVVAVAGGGVVVVATAGGVVIAAAGSGCHKTMLQWFHG